MFERHFDSELSAVADNPLIVNNIQKVDAPKKEAAEKGLQIIPL